MIDTFHKTLTVITALTLMLFLNTATARAVAGTQVLCSPDLDQLTISGETFFVSDALFPHLKKDRNKVYQSTQEGNLFSAIEDFSYTCRLPSRTLTVKVNYIGLSKNWKKIFDQRDLKAIERRKNNPQVYIGSPPKTKHIFEEEIQTIQQAIKQYAPTTLEDLPFKIKKLGIIIDAYRLRIYNGKTLIVNIDRFNGRGNYTLGVTKLTVLQSGIDAEYMPIDYFVTGRVIREEYVKTIKANLPVTYLSLLNEALGRRKRYQLSSYKMDYFSLRACQTVEQAKSQFLEHRCPEYFASRDFMIEQTQKMLDIYLKEKAQFKEEAQ